MFFEDYTLNELSDNSYENTFQLLIEMTTDTVPPLDNRVRDTVCSIIHEFLLNIENSLLFVCDNQDLKSQKRKNHFDIWYTKFSHGTTIEKLNVEISSGDCIYTYASLLVSKKHPQFDLIKDDFEKIPEIIDKN